MAKGEPKNAKVSETNPRNAVRGKSESIKSLALKARKAFFSRDNSDYFNGSNSQTAKKAYEDYVAKRNAFKEEWLKAGGSRPAFEDVDGDGAWSELMLDVASGNISAPRRKR